MVILRQLRRDDIDTIASFEREIAKISFPDDPILDIGFYAKKMARLVGDPEIGTFVADNDGAPVGWAYVSKRTNFITKEVYADFHSIYVAPNQRGSGVVSKLANAIVDYCTGQKLSKVVFRTRATNEPMKAVLARHGYVATQIYYERPVGSDEDERRARDEEAHEKQNG
jgi:L-amino acid N-acyltransferase YncA